MVRTCSRIAVRSSLGKVDPRTRHYHRNELSPSLEIDMRDQPSGNGQSSWQGSYGRHDSGFDNNAP